MTDASLGPIMIAATKIIKTPATRIGSLGPNVTLPRTIPLASLISGSIGVVVGVIVGAILGSVSSILVSGILFGALGVLTTTWSPVKGETLFQWLGVQTTNRIRQTKIRLGDDTVALYIGIARLHRVNNDRTRIAASAVTVYPRQYDERGVFRSSKNKNTFFYANSSDATLGQLVNKSGNLRENLKPSPNKI